MVEEKSVRIRPDISRSPASSRTVLVSRLLRTFLLAAGVTILLTTAEIGVPLLFKLPLAGGSAIQHFSDVPGGVARDAFLLLIPGVEFTAVFLIALVSIKPVALLAYLRSIGRAREHSYRRSIPAIQPEQNSHQLVLGAAGAGKTTMLRLHQRNAAQRRWDMIRGRAKVPVYAPMKYYSLFLKEHVQEGATGGAGSSPRGRGTNTGELIDGITLFDFLYESDLPGLRHLRPHLKHMAQRGQLLLLCDDLNEVDSLYLDTVCAELEYLMCDTGNRLLMTCRTADYDVNPRLKQLAVDGQAVCAEISQLQQAQIREFVEHSIEEQGENIQWMYTAGQVMEAIDHSRFRDFCTNPMMLLTLLDVIDEQDVGRVKQMDTRGLLLREFVSELIKREQKRPLWSGKAPAYSDVIAFLSEIASAARWRNARDTIRLPFYRTGGKAGRTSGSTDAGESLLVWLDEHSLQGAFVTGTLSWHEPYDSLECSKLLQFAQNAGLIDLSSNGVLCFRHELIAEYFVAEFFCAMDSMQQPAWLFREELLAGAANWSEVVAFWTGLLDDPVILSERLATFELASPVYLLEALSLSLVCTGVLWTPPQAERQYTITLPTSVEKALAEALRDADTRARLAAIFTRCAEEGGQEIYRSLFSLLMIEGIDEWLTLLDEEVVPTLLFNQLAEVIDDAKYEAQVQRLMQLLGQLGDVAVTYAAELSQPVSTRSLRLRAAAVIILGRTNQQRAVEPLIARLGDAEQLIRDRATRALIRLGPELSLDLIVEELESRAIPSITRPIHSALLTILESFLKEQNASDTIMAAQRQRILEAILLVLSSNYGLEAQQQAKELLVRQGSITPENTVSSLAVWMLVQSLSSNDETMARNAVQVLQEIGAVGTPALLFELEQQPPEAARARIVEVFAGMRELDLRALPYVLRLLADPSLAVQQQVASALRMYAPDSISDLIELVLFDASEMVATRAAQVLGDIGIEVIEPVTQALGEVVQGRTRLLVYVLEHVRDQRAIPALIALLEKTGIDSLLAVAIVHVLSQYPDERVVSPLISILASPDVLLHEAAVNALSSLGEMALDNLIAALDVDQETEVMARVRRVILGIVPFPGERLIEMLTLVSEAQALQIMEVLLAKGSDAAQMLVTYLAHPDQRVQEYMRHTLTRMEGHVAVPVLLEVLHHPALQPVVNELLHTYPQEAIPQLVSLLGEPERGDAAATLLAAFGVEALPALVSGLDDPSDVARERTRDIIVYLVHQTPEILPRVVQLFSVTSSQRAHEGLLDIVTSDLAGPVGTPLATTLVPALLEGLEDIRLIEGASEALVRLAHRQDEYSNIALSSLFAALRVEERREGAKIALVNVGVPAIRGVMDMLIDADQATAYTAQQILREMRATAFPFIWAACSDVSNPARREAALKTFSSMTTMEIKDGLIEHLMGDEPQDISMSLGLLLERIYNEMLLARQDQEMMRALLEHVQMHNEERAAQRIIALLLLVGGSDVASHIAWGLYHYHDHPNQQERLARTFLLLGAQAEEILLEMLRYRATPPDLLAEIISVLGMLTPHQEVYEYARTIGNPGSSMYQSNVTHLERQAIALRALGGLLAGGHLDLSTLQNRQSGSLYGSAEHELYSVLLGKPYGPLVTRLENELRSAQYEYEKDRRELALRMNLVEREKEALEEDYRELEERNQQLEAMNRRLVESNQRLQQRLLGGRDAGIQ
jgi:HEAT repeat protein